MALIDKEVKKLIYTIFGAAFLLLGFAWFAAHGGSLFNTATGIANTVTGNKTYDTPYSNTLDKNKEYYLNVETSLGTMKFRLYKDNAPVFVNNIVSLVKDNFYKNSTYAEKLSKLLLLGKGGNTENVSYNLIEEINAKSIGLDKVKVSDLYGALLNTYDSSLLSGNLNVPIMDFYHSQGYTYSTNIQSVTIKKGSLVMYSTAPGHFGNMFFISTTGSIPEYDGRMVNIGEIVSGNDILDQINSTSADQISLISLQISDK